MGAERGLYGYLSVYHTLNNNNNNNNENVISRVNTLLQMRSQEIPIRVTSFGLRLMHKPAYEKRWVETVVRRSSQKLFFLFFWACDILAYLLC
jgi:hypothetical protein